MGPVRQNPIHRTVRTAHLSVTAHNFQYTVAIQYRTVLIISPLTSRQSSLLRCCLSDLLDPRSLQTFYHSPNVLVYNVLMASLRIPGNFVHLCSCYLDLDPMTFMYELHPNPLKMYPQTKKWTFYVTAFESYRLKLWSVECAVRIYQSLLLLQFSHISQTICNE